METDVNEECIQCWYDIWLSRRSQNTVKRCGSENEGKHALHREIPTWRNEPR